MKLTPFAKLLLVLIVLGSLGYGLWLNKDQISLNNLISNTTVISKGEVVLSVPNEYKEEGVNYFKNKDYVKALASFNKAISVKKNDGEARIYLENTNIFLTKAPYYKIAVAGPFSGKQSQKGEALLQGVAYVQKLINSEGGIKGKKLLLVLGDDKSSTEGAIEVATELIKDKEVLGVIGHIASNASLAAAPIYNSAKLTMISPSSGSPELTNAGEAIFRVIPSDEYNSKLLAHYVIKTLKINKIGIFKDSLDQYSQGLADNFAKEFTKLKGQVVDVKEFSTIAPNNLSFVQEMNKKGPKGILLASSSATQAINIAEIVKELNLNLTLIGGHGLYTQELLTQGKNYVQGLYVSSPWHAKVNKPEVTKFAKTFEQIFGGQANARSALAADALLLLVSVIERFPEADRETLVKKVAEIGKSLPPFYGTTGVTAFDKNGDVYKPIVILQVQNNQFVPVAVVNL